jgi:thiamine pyrophosphokinase
MKHTLRKNSPNDTSSALIANGHFEDLLFLAPSIKTHSRIVAVDRGLIYCKQLGITPDLIVGDFDSVPRSLLDEYAHIPSIALPKEKDETDLEIALEHELEISQKVTLFGALGKRIDHTLTNLLIALRYPERVVIETEQEIVFAIQGNVDIPMTIGQTISLLPINGPVTGITTRGLQWELANRTLDASFIGISNVCLQTPVQISIQQGILLCVLILSVNQDAEDYQQGS